MVQQKVTGKETNSTSNDQQYNHHHQTQGDAILVYQDRPKQPVNDINCSLSTIYRNKQQSYTAHNELFENPQPLSNTQNQSIG